MSLTTLVAVSMCLVSCGLAQNPVPPDLPDTFEAEGEVEFHGAEITDFGSFVIVRDQLKGMGYQREDYDSRGPGGEIAESVLRYDMNKTFYIRGSKADPHCIEEARNATEIPKFWAWLDYAVYEGTVTVREVIYDVWATNVGGIRLEFGKSRTDASIPFFYRHKSTESSTFFSIVELKATPPNPDIFQIPDACLVL